MTNRQIKTAIRASQNARRHEKAILEALKAVDKLAASGLAGDGYGLAPAQGGKIVSAPKPSMTKARMTYCA